MGAGELRGVPTHRTKAANEGESAEEATRAAGRDAAGNDVDVVGGTFLIGLDRLGDWNITDYRIGGSSSQDLYIRRDATTKKTGMSRIRGLNFRV